jgi:hypothetical protein
MAIQVYRSEVSCHVAVPCNDLGNKVLEIREQVELVPDLPTEDFRIPAPTGDNIAESLLNQTGPFAGVIELRVPGWLCCERNILPTASELLSKPVVFLHVWLGGVERK